MKFFTHHIRDFNNATRHLTRIERSIYRDMIDLYFDSELPLPLDIALLCKRVLAREEVEKAAVLAVLDEFFTEKVDGWHSQRCDEEIAEAVIRMDEADRKRENERDRQDRHRDRRKGLFAQLREFDEVPPYDTSTEQLQLRLNTHLSRVTERRQDASATANHIPYPISHIPIEQTHRADALAGDAGPVPVEPKFNAKAALIAAGVDKQKVTDYLLIRKTKKLPLTLTAYEGLQREAELAGIDVPAAVLACCENGWAGFKSAWYRNLAASTQARGAPSALNDQKFRPNSSDYSSSDAAMARTIERHGIVIDPNEDIKF